MLPPSIDLSHLDTEEALQRMGEALKMCLQTRGVGVFLLRPNGNVTVLPSWVLDKIPDDDMAFALINAWDESEITEYLANRKRDQPTNHV